MAERRGYDQRIVAVGELLAKKRKALGYKSRVDFIEQRSRELFSGQPWISERHLANVELGKNWISIEKLISHSYALETSPMVLLEEIIHTIDANNGAN